MKPYSFVEKKKKSNPNFPMAESASSSASPTPVLHLDEDPLRSILLLLPVDSIVSFGMTCKKFNASATSDAVWESICKRDLTPSSMDALKSSLHHHHPIPWMSLYKQHTLHSGSCRKLSSHPDANSLVPSPRASHSINFVSDYLVLFGGGCEGGRHFDDTWVADFGNNFRRMPVWRKIHSGDPIGRNGHSCVVIDPIYLVLFGGFDDRGTPRNDTWVAKFVTHQDITGITLSWERLVVNSIPPPPPRGAHAACCISNRKMVIHGGIGLRGFRLEDTWVLELSENFDSGAWSQVVAHPPPPPRSGHTMTSIGGTQAVLFGGRGLENEVLSDVWLLDMSEGYSQWEQIRYELQNVPQGFSLPRVGHSASLISGGLVLIYGGEDSHRHRKDDFWSLDISALPSARVQRAGRFNSNANMWRRLEPMGYKPNSRSFHRACADNSGRYLYVFGGMVDGSVEPAKSSGLRYDGELFRLKLPSQL